MGIHGKRDPEAEKRRIEAAQKGGFGQKGIAGRPKKDSTDAIEEKAAERMDGLVDKALDAIERGLKSGNEKTALTASAQFFKTFHHPTQKVDVSASVEKTEYHLHMLKEQNALTESDQDLLGEFLDVLRDAADEDIVEAQVIEDEPEQLPETTEE